MPSPLAPSNPVPGVTTPPGFKANPNGKFLGDWGYDANGTPYLPNGTVFDGLGGGTNLPNPVQAVTNVVNAGKSVQDFLGSLSNVNLWRRIGIGVLGALFLWWGILIILSSNKQIQGAVTKGAKAIVSKTPEGAAANIATGALGA
jgi:hypothetical protein